MAVLEWTEPPFAPGHWLPDMVTAAGAIPVLGVAGERSHTIEWADMAAARPDIVVVAPCGYRLDAAADQAAGLVGRGLLPATAEVWAVDADAAFVRPGPRLVDGVEALAGVAHPGTCAERADLARVVRR
jgi:iron complex transport system substrate-binding protein